MVRHESHLAEVVSVVHVVQRERVAAPGPGGQYKNDPLCGVVELEPVEHDEVDLSESLF